MSSNILVVCYSRTGHTAQVAKAIAAELGADLELIREPRGRKGLWGYLRSGFEARRGIAAAIEPSRVEAAQYDVVVIGTPIWAGSLSSPVRAYLAAKHASLAKVAFFLTCGGNRPEPVFSQMESACGQRPVARLAVRELELASCQPQIARFAETVRRVVPRHAAPPVSLQAAPSVPPR